MTDEFIDFYEILELPVEAERSEVRKRISELYIEAQKNLDHRNFNTRVRYQQLFEITLPQARYILLDDGRRDDYDRLVRASRAPVGGDVATPQVPSQKADAAQSSEMGQQPGGFRLSPAGTANGNGAAGEAPTIDNLPDTALDPVAVAREREELWNKWKSGLQGAMEREAAKEKAREQDAPSPGATPLADRIEAVQTGAPQPQSGLGEPSTPIPAPSSAPAAATASVTSGAAPRAKVERAKVKFDFGGNEPDNAPRRGESAPVPGAEEIVEAAKGRLTPEQIEERRNNHRREIMREELENTGVKGVAIGAAAILVPGIVAMTIFMSTYYPPRQVSTLPIKSAALAWLLGLIALSGLAYFSARMLSKSLRRKQAMQLQMLSYEELLRHTNKDI